MGARRKGGRQNRPAPTEPGPGWQSVPTARAGSTIAREWCPESDTQRQREQHYWFPESNTETNRLTPLTLSVPSMRGLEA